MHADLMGAPRLQPAFQQRAGRGRAGPLNHAGAGDGMAAPGPADSLFLSVGAVAPQMRGDAQDVARLERDATQTAQARVRRIGPRVAQGQLAALRRVFLGLGGKAVMRSV